MIVLLAAAAWAAAAPAATPGPDPQSLDRRFDELDRTRDGFLSRDEAKDAAELETRFSELDANNDDKLSRDEYRLVSAGEAVLPGAPSAASGDTSPAADPSRRTER
ncbi:MAG TPA: hypothetical protein VF211_05675 [Burkholderiales bacterium]